MNDTKMHNCITECWKCRSHCQETFFNHCLVEGGQHVKAKHVKLMTDCIQMCQTAADFMTRNSGLHSFVCQVCAEICESCAESCENIGGIEMEQCAEICRSCAETCRGMAEIMI